MRYGYLDLLALVAAFAVAITIEPTWKEAVICFVCGWMFPNVYHDIKGHPRD